MLQLTQFERSAMRRFRRNGGVLTIDKANLAERDLWHLLDRLAAGEFVEEVSHTTETVTYRSKEAAHQFRSGQVVIWSWRAGDRTLEGRVVRTRPRRVQIAVQDAAGYNVLCWAHPDTLRLKQPGDPAGQPFPDL